MKNTNEFLLNKLEELNDSLLNIYPEYLLSQQEELNNKMEEAANLDGIDLVSHIGYLKECIKPDIEANPEDINIELLIEDFIKWFAYTRELKRREIKIEEWRKRGE